MEKQGYSTKREINNIGKKVKNISDIPYRQMSNRGVISEVIDNE